MADLFDVQCGFGGAKPGQRRSATVEELLEQMERLSIARALVRIAPEDMDRDVPASNRVLYQTCDRHRSLVPCPTLLPASGGDVPGEPEQVELLISQGAGAAHLRPRKDYWSTAEWASGGLFAALAERRVPVLCNQNAFGLETVAELSRRYPQLPFILFEVGYRLQRTLLALLRTCPNVLLSIGNPFSVHFGVEHLVKEVGAQRLLFGTGFPEADPMPAVSMLMYAELSDADKQLIGAGNFDRLIEGMKR